MVAQPHTNLRKRCVETADGVDQHIENEVLCGGNIDFVGLGRSGENLAQLPGTVEKGQSVRQELPALLGERLRPALPPALAVKLHAQSALERQQTVAHALLG